MSIDPSRFGTAACRGRHPGPEFGRAPDMLRCNNIYMQRSKVDVKGRSLRRTIRSAVLHHGEARPRSFASNFKGT